MPEWRIIYFFSPHDKSIDKNEPILEILLLTATGNSSYFRDTVNIRESSPECKIKKVYFFDILVFIQSTDLVSMVYSCIGAEIEDSDGSGTSDTRVTPDAERSTTISEAPGDTRSNGHVGPSEQQPDRQERIVPLADTQVEREEDGPSGGGTRPEPPPQITKPSLASMRQRHLQDSLGNTSRSHFVCSTF